MRNLLIDTFSLMRGAVGVGTWIAPGASMRLFGVGGDARQPFVARLFGARDMALALAIQDSNPALRRRALQMGLFCDSLDLVASLFEIKSRRFGPRGIVLGTGGILVFLGMGAAALLREKDGS